MTKQKIRKAVHEIDPALDGDQFDTACILVASLSEGPNVKRISKVLGLPRGEVAKRGRNLRSNGLWNGGKVAAAGWFEEHGGIEFALHCAVADGMLEVS